MKTFGVVGHVGHGKKLANGQTVKTKSLVEELASKLGEDVQTVDTHDWQRRPLRLLYHCFQLIRTCKHIVLMPAYKGVRVFLPLFVLMNVCFRRRIHYVVIGGWLVEFLQKHKSLLFYTRRLASIHVESFKMKSGLEKLGHTNVHYMPNFKRLPRLSEVELESHHQAPYALCTFSRIMKEKGIEDAVQAVTEINKKKGHIVCTLDIYGAVEAGQEQWFEQLMARSPSFIRYRGIVSHDQSVTTLKSYFLLLFPTYFPGEGFAGTLLDCLASGVPVLATYWRYNGEIVKDGITGYLYDRKEPGLTAKLEELLSNPRQVLDLKPHCLREYDHYDPDHVIAHFLAVASGEDGSQSRLHNEILMKGYDLDGK